MTIDEYATLEEDQNWVCAICQSPAKLQLDHCHLTSKVRQLLCTRCNVGVALLESKMLPSYQAYIEKHWERHGMETLEDS